MNKLNYNFTFYLDWSFFRTTTWRDECWCWYDNYKPSNVFTFIVGVVIIVEKFLWPFSGHWSLKRSVAQKGLMECHFTEQQRRQSSPQFLFYSFFETSRNRTSERVENHQ